MLRNEKKAHLICITVDVEEWYNILAVESAPKLEAWHLLEERLPRNMERLLDLFERYEVRATMFWLGYFAEKYPDLVKECVARGHEIASHGYGHVLAYEVGRDAFSRDIRHGKEVLENIAQREVKGFRAAGFSLTQNVPWAFDEIRAAGYIYDSSIFPASRSHGGMKSAQMAPCQIATRAGMLQEFPQSVLDIGKIRWSVFGGGYLRLAPRQVLKLAAGVVQKRGRPVIIYVHPREIDPEHPRLAMNGLRRFKSYYNLQSTFGKLEYLCQTYDCRPMSELI